MPVSKFFALKTQVHSLKLGLGGPARKIIESFPRRSTVLVALTPDDLGGYAKAATGLIAQHHGGTTVLKTNKRSLAYGCACD